jgi:hypothetical protein
MDDDDVFLLARIDEDEHLARVAYHATMSQVDLERILRTCAARRAIVRLYREAKYKGDPDAAPYLVAVKTLAAIYDDHPDYKPDWRPTPST